MNNELYKRSLELAPFGFACHKIVQDKTGKPIDYIFLEVNAAFEKLTGLNAQEIVGKSLLTVLPMIKDDPFDWVQYYGEIAIHGGEKIFEQFSLAQNRWYKVHVYSPEKFYFVTSFVDITNEKQNLEQLEKFFEINLDMLCIADTEGNFRRVNPSWNEVLGYSEKELLSYKFFDLIHPDDLGSTLDAIRDLKDQKKVLDFVNRYRCKNGSYRYIEWRSNPHNNLIYAAARDITERLITEQEIKTSAEKFKNLVRDMQVGVILQGPHAEMILNNQKALELLGVTQEQLLGRSSFHPYWNVIHEDGTPYPGETHPVPISIATKKPVYGAVMGVFRPISNDRVWLQVDAVPQFNQDGSVEHVVVSFVDISARKKAEADLSEKNELLSLFVLNSPVYCFIKDVTKDQSKVLYASDNFVDMIGINGRDMAGKTMEELFPLEFAKKISQDDWAVASKGDVLKIDEELNGRYYTTIKFPITQSSKTLLAGYTIDITDRKKIEEELRKQNALLASLLKNLPIGVFMVEAPSGKPLVANDAAFELLGRGILPDASATNLEQIYKAYKASTNQPYPPLEMPILIGMDGKSAHIDDLIVERPDGTRKQLEIFGSPVLDETGKVWASLVSFLDITERKKLEEKLSNYQNDLKLTVARRTKELNDSNQRLQEFAHVVSHDMKGPLRGISTLISFINEEATRLSAKQNEYFSSIQKRVARLYSQIEAILEYSSIDGTSENVGPINTLEIVREVLEMLEPPKTFSFEIQELPTVYFSRQKLYQVFQNLIGNSIKFSGANGIVKIWCEEYSTYFKFFIQDNGEGIEQKHFDKIFVLFQTLHTRDEVEGTGVGLAIVKKIIEGHGGKVTVESKLGAGATFSFTVNKANG